MPSSMRPTSTKSGVVRGQRQIAENGEPERECDRHAGEYRCGDHADEKDQQIEIAEPVKDRLAEPEQHDQAATAPSATKMARGDAALASRSTANTAISAMPTGSAAARKRIADFERRRRDRQLPRARNRRPARR